MCDILALERRHAKPDLRSLVVPARKRAPERELAIDAATRASLERWMTVRRTLRVRPAAPLFCTLANGNAGRRLQASYLRQMLNTRGDRLAIDRRVSAEGLRHSGKAHREHIHWSIESQIGPYLDEDRFAARNPDAHEHWQTALELLQDSPIRGATRIGHECREAMASFAHARLDETGGKHEGLGTVQMLRRLIAVAEHGQRTTDHAEALVTYWGTVSDLVQRQVHGAAREQERLGGEDARRVVFHTMIVMFEVDRLVVTTSR